MTHPPGPGPVPVPVPAPKGVFESFGAVRVPRDVSPEPPPGEVRAPAGENGAGRTAPVRTLAGAHRPDTGQVLLDGEPVVFHGPGDARRSFRQTRGLFQEHPGLKGIASPAAVGIKAAAPCLSGPTYKGRVRLTGPGTQDDPHRCVGNGTVEAFAPWDRAGPGALAARTAVAPAFRRIGGGPGETSGSGGTTYTLGRNGVTGPGRPAVFGARTTDRYHFRGNGDCSCSACASC
ncbi:ATP-binding cassette domain-containing protein [Streptomyces sp. WELS2]|uniref:ATP-binding cassette domain-containing protein n=1 Tax=Streptomyces sp. WELS2 TaxID=2749435 RepID=UPI0037DD03FD